MTNSSRKEGNQFDKVFKENIEAIILPLLDKLTGIDFQIIRKISEKLQSTIEREADYLAVIKDSEGQEQLLHLEFQVQGDSKMIYRLTEYHGILLRKYELPILHIVVYLGNGSFNSRKILTEKETFTGFTLVDVKSLDYRQLLDSDVPEEVVLAILANFSNKNPEAVIRLILQKLKNLSSSPSSLEKFVIQLGILSRIRNLTSELIKAKEDMPIVFDYDVQEDPLFKQGVDLGMENMLTGLVLKQYSKGYSIQQIANNLELSESKVLEIIDEDKTL